MKRIVAGMAAYDVLAVNDFVAAAIVVASLTGLGIYLLVTGIMRKVEDERRAERLREDILDQRPEWRER